MSYSTNFDLFIKMQIPSQEQLDNCDHSPEIEKLDSHYRIYCGKCLLYTVGKSKEETQTNWKDKIHVKRMNPMW